MKIKFLLPVMFLFFLGISCSIDDDNGGISAVEAHLTGRWVLEGHTVNGIYTAATEEEILEFKPGGEIEGEFEEEEVTGNYTVSGNQLALNFQNGGGIFNIETLNVSTLRLFIREEFDDVQGVDEVMYHFRKLPN